MSGTPHGKLSCIATQASATLLITSSAGFGAHYAWTTGSLHGPILGALTVAMALGLELAKPFAIEGVLSAARRFALGRALVLTILAVVAVTYSLTAELSLMASTRQDRASERQRQTPAAKAASDRVEATRKELAGLPVTRPSTAIEIELNKLKSTPKLGPCSDPTAPDYGPVSRRVCPEIAAAEAERTTALRREALQGVLNEAEQRISSESSDKASDPASGALAGYLAAFGMVTVPTGTIFDWLTLIPVIALETGSALSLVLARSVTGGQPVQSRLPSAPMGDATIPVQLAAEHSAEHPIVANPVALSNARLAVLNRLVTSGGRIESGQRQLARELGVSPTRVHQVLHQLAAERRIRLRAGPGGTLIEVYD